MSKHKAWKDHERRIAKRLGGERVGNRGSNTEDVAHPWLSIECKARAMLPGWLTGAMRQAEINAPAGRLPVVIAHQHGDRSDNDLVVMRFGDFVEWFGDEGATDATG